MDEVFRLELGPTMNYQASWNGYEHNALLLSRGGKDYLNAAYPLGVGFEFDARGVISDDLDGDGRMDLLVVESRGLTRTVQKVHVMRNRMQTDNHWIGVRLRARQDGLSPLGATVRVHTGGRTQIRQIVTGDSYNSQHAPVVHVGLGATDQVDHIEIHWSDGMVEKVQQPDVDEWHAVGARPITLR
jgi:hypothetical protein